MEGAKAKGTVGSDGTLGKGRRIGKGREEGGREEEGEVRLEVTCAKEIRPPHSILTDRPGEGSAIPPPRDRHTHTHIHTPPSITLPFCYHTFL